MNSLKKILVSNTCFACGLCFSSTDLLIEDSTGKATVNQNGIVPKERLSEINEVISNCPSQSLSLVDCSLTTSSGTEGLEQLVQIATDKLVNYKFVMPDFKAAPFNPNEYQLPSFSGKNEGVYDYRSSNSAIREGLNDFKKVVYSQRGELCRKIIIEYKIKYLSKYLNFEEKPGNYYFEFNCTIQRLLNELYENYKSLNGNMDYLPKDFCNFDINDYVKFTGRFNSLIADTETALVNFIVDKLDPLSDYSYSIDYDDAGRYYCYYIKDAVRECLSNIISETGDAIMHSTWTNTPKSIMEELTRPIIEAIHTKGESFIAAIKKNIQ